MFADWRCGAKVWSTPIHQFNIVIIEQCVIGFCSKGGENLLNVYCGLKLDRAEIACGGPLHAFSKASTVLPKHRGDLGW